MNATIFDPLLKHYFLPYDNIQNDIIEKTLTIHITRQLIKRNPEKGKERAVQMLDFSSIQTSILNI
jgi:hypothetical protein